jgi:colanic acid biosynthesis glycosyl transferase WcaI
MHIMLITEGFAPETDARASRSFDHAVVWAGLGHKVTILTKAPNFPAGKVFTGYKNHWRHHENMEGVDVWRVWSYLTPNKGIIKRLLSFLSFMVLVPWHGWRLRKKTGRPDVIIGTCPTLFAPLGAWLLAKILRVPFVFEVRDLWPESAVAVGMLRENSVGYRIFKCLANHLYNQAALIVPVGEGYEAQILENYPQAAGKCLIIPNGFRPDLFVPEATTTKARETLQLPADKVIVLYIGTLGRSQKLETIFEAAKLLEKQENILFVIAGDGEEREYLEQLLQKNPQDNVKMMGAQPKNLVPVYYNACDIALSPLRKSEVFKGRYPAKMFEVMAMAKPLILGGEGISCDLLHTAQAGIAVEPENAPELASAILQLADNAALRQEMGKSGYYYVQTRYARPALAALYAKGIRDLIKVSV